MIRNKMFWILSFFLVTVIIIVIAFSNDEVKISPSYRTSSMSNLLLTQKEGNNIKWELSADRAIIPEGKKEIYLELLSLTINKSPQIFLTSSSGTYEMEKGNFTLNKPVELRIEENRFVTSSLTWNSNSELITTDAPIKLSGKNFLIEGTGLTARVKQEKVTVTKDVKAIFYH